MRDDLPAIGESAEQVREPLARASLPLQHLEVDITDGCWRTCLPGYHLRLRVRDSLLNGDAVDRAGARKIESIQRVEARCGGASVTGPQRCDVGGERAVR